MGYSIFNKVGKVCLSIGVRIGAIYTNTTVVLDLVSVLNR